MLDRESQSSYWLTVHVQDHGSVPLSNSVEVYIKVGDVNDNAPTSDQPVYYVSVRENSPADVNIVIIKVSGDDSYQ